MAMPVASCPLWSSTELGSKSSSHADGVHQEPAQMELVKEVSCEKTGSEGKKYLVT
jgi:hypothetical protein